MEVRLSGTNLVSVLDLVYEFTGSNRRATTAIARRLHSAMAEAVDRVDPAVHGGAMPPIVIDDRVPAVEARATG